MLAECGEDDQLQRLSCEERLERTGGRSGSYLDCNSEDLFVREPTKVHHGGWITLEKFATTVTSCNLVGFC